MKLDIANEDEDNMLQTALLNWNTATDGTHTLLSELVLLRKWEPKPQIGIKDVEADNQLRKVGSGSGAKSDVDTTKKEQLDVQMTEAPLLKPIQRQNVKTDFGDKDNGAESSSSSPDTDLNSNMPLGGNSEKDQRKDDELEKDPRKEDKSEIDPEKEGNLEKDSEKGDKTKRDPRKQGKSERDHRKEDKPEKKHLKEGGKGTQSSGLSSLETLPKDDIETEIAKLNKDIEKDRIPQEFGLLAQQMAVPTKQSNKISRTIIREMIKTHGKNSPEVKAAIGRLLQTAKKKFTSCKRCCIAFEDGHPDEPVSVVEHKGRKVHSVRVNDFRVVFTSNRKLRKNALEFEAAIDNTLHLDKVDEQRARAVLKEFNRELMHNHSNIRFLSVGAISLKETRKYKPCIVVCVSMKGFIPFFEKPLPKRKAGVLLKVYDDTYENHVSLPAYRKHENLIMGCKISAIEIKNKNKSVRDARYSEQPNETEESDSRETTESVKFGTLGAFVSYRIGDDNKVGLLTAAHAVIPEVKLSETYEWGSRDSHFRDIRAYIPVYQPSDTNNFIGFVRWYYHVEHYCDVALVELIQKERVPLSGRFPDSMGSFHVQRPLVFASGDVLIDPDRERLTREGYCAYKYGCATGLTKGKFVNNPFMCGVVPPDMTSDDEDTIDNMCVSGCNGMVFSDKGDSGAIVFAGKERNDRASNDELYAVGMIGGGFRGTNKTIVIPLKRVFDKFKKFYNTELKLIEFRGFNSIPQSKRRNSTE